MFAPSIAVRCLARIADARRAKIINRVLKAQDGAVAAEYAFLLALMALVAAGGFIVTGQSLSGYFTAVSKPVEAAAVNMPNPLGGGGAAGGSGGRGGSGGGSTGGGSSSGGSGGGGSGGGSSGGGNGGGNGGGKIK